MNTDDQTENPLPENNESEQQQPAELKLSGYCMKTKTKDVPILDGILKKTAKGTYMASGHDGSGNKMTTIVGAEKALALVKAGIAKMAE